MSYTVASTYNPISAIQGAVSYTVNFYQSTASSDYTSIDAVMDITGDRDCFQVALIDDDIAESVESFDLYLEAGSAEDNVTFIQRTFSIIITDDGELPSSCRPLNSHCFTVRLKVFVQSPSKSYPQFLL